ncbi:MAG TPA: divergent PAP2 family protein [Anaerolineae bacterium]|nr:divergent PAP2 family protein [Anaerolineae bacterium]
MATFLSWGVAQGLKVLLHLIAEGKLDLRYLVSAGGMPSAHSAFAASLATGVALQEGLRSPLFAMAAAFAIVVMFDAQGVRRATSAQARILNQILDELFQGHPISEERLRELIGHTPVEVLVGAAMGVVLTWVWMAL